jgi:hypothetical protein
MFKNYSLINNEKIFQIPTQILYSTLYNIMPYLCLCTTKLIKIHISVATYRLIYLSMENGAT